jgi:RNA-directed DNA polymerase
MEEKKMEQKTVKAFRSTASGEAQAVAKEGTRSFVAKPQSERPMFPSKLMEEVVHADNVKQALKRVESNAGSPGVDGMKVEKLREYLKQNWFEIRRTLLSGDYKPKPVRKVSIPKSGGGTRDLGIPTVLDRFIQQALLQVLQPKWDKTFSEHSYGFRPGRSAHQAVSKAQEYLLEGYSFVVDIDLEKFFDRVNHDMLLGRLAKRIEDKRILKLIRAYLNAGVLDEGLVKTRDEGTPQGGPLSPWFSNVVLDDLDRELEKRGHRFVRYADDCNIYVRSERAGERVMASIGEFIKRKLKLKVNESKSAIARPAKRKFLGFSFTVFTSKRRISPQALEKFKLRVRVITNRNRGRSIEQVIKDLARYLNGWADYFGYCQTPSVLKNLDSWIRRRLRSLIWRQWKLCRPRVRELVRRGVSLKKAWDVAKSGKGPWRMSHTSMLQVALPDSYFTGLGLPRLAARNI